MKKQTIHVLVFTDFSGGFAPHEQGELTIHFNQIDELVPTLEFDGPLWAFVDWRSPGISGIELCRRLRCNPGTAHANIVAMLDEDTAPVRRRAAQVGVIDYTMELLTRESVIERILRLHHVKLEPLPLEVGELTIDMAARQARWRNKPIHLMPIQLRLMQFLVQHPGQIFTRRQLIEALGNFETGIDDRTVDVWIRRIRIALGKVGADGILQTVRSVGYVLNAPISPRDRRRLARRQGEKRRLSQRPPLQPSSPEPNV
jgi:two-component system phosphate regulon response regulator PhoB